MSDVRKRFLAGKGVIGVAAVIIIRVFIGMRAGNNELSGTTWQTGKDGGETITFGRDGSFVTSGYKNDATGTYSVDSDKLTLVYNESKEKGETYT